MDVTVSVVNVCENPTAIQSEELSGENVDNKDMVTAIKSPEHSPKKEPRELSGKMKAQKAEESEINVPESPSEIEYHENSNKRFNKRNMESRFNFRKISPPIEHQNKPSTVMDTTDDSRNASYWNGAYVVLILVVVILNTAILTLIPRQNSIRHPEYWYQSIVLFVVGVSIRYTCYTIIELSLFTDTNFLLSVKAFAKFFFWVSLTFEQLCNFLH